MACVYDEVLTSCKEEQIYIIGKKKHRKGNRCSYRHSDIFILCLSCIHVSMHISIYLATYIHICHESRWVLWQKKLRLNKRGERTKRSGKLDHIFTHMQIYTHTYAHWITHIRKHIWHGNKMLVEGNKKKQWEEEGSGDGSSKVYQLCHYWVRMAFKSAFTHS